METKNKICPFISMGSNASLPVDITIDNGAGEDVKTTTLVNHTFCLTEKCMAWSPFWSKCLLIAPNR